MNAQRLPGVGFGRSRATLTLGRWAGVVLAGVVGFASVPALAQRAAAGQARPGEPKTDEKSLSLGVGESKTLPATDIKQYSEGAAGIAEIKTTPDGKKFIISGQKAGTTSLLLIKNDGTQVNWTIRVYSQAPNEVESELEQLLQGYTGIRVRRIGTRLFIEGGVQNQPDMDRIKQIAELYPGQVESLVTVGTGAVDRNLNIRIDFFFVQYNQNSSYGVGLDWPGRFGGEATISTELGFDFITRQPTAIATVANHPLPALDFAASRGWAKVLKQSAVITTNGNEATFESGGEVNVEIATGLAVNIQQIRYGTNVTVQPRYDPRSGKIEVKLQAEVSDLTPSAGSTLPGRNTSKLSTLVFLKIGESLILSGIRTRGQRHQINGMPYLSRIPVLGVLFGSHSDSEEEIEGSLFIIPSVVESVPKASYDMVKAAMDQYEDYSGDIETVNSFSKAPPAYGGPGPEAPAKK
ncbi:type II and III secretion system protein family protein [Chondromyces apiculatus]|nr:pilus assembly protein N-terminal domain-containing protein [Chondromyces apiculatus]